MFCRVNACSVCRSICAEHAGFRAERFDHDLRSGVFVDPDRYLIDFQPEHFDHDVKSGVFVDLDHYLIDVQPEQFEHDVKYRIFVYLDRGAPSFDHSVKRVYCAILGRKFDHHQQRERRRHQQLSLSIWPAVC